MRVPDDICHIAHNKNQRMLTKVEIESERLEIYVSSVQMIVVAVVAEVALGVATFYFATNARIAADMAGGRYVFIGVLGFFFLAIASGLWPLFNSARNGNRQLIWAATHLGLEVPAVTTTFNKTRPPILYEWSQIKKVLFVDKLIQKEDGTTFSWNRVLVLSDDLKLPKNLLFRFVGSQYKLKDGTFYQAFHFPKARKADVVRKLRELAPGAVSVEQLNRYEID